MKVLQKVCAVWLAMMVLIGVLPIRSMASATEANTIAVVKDSAKDSAIELDGSLTENVWQPMHSVEKQIVGSTAPFEAAFNVTWDNQNMYIGVRATTKATDKTLVQDGSISYYLSPKNSRGDYTKDDFQVQISERGTNIQPGYTGWAKNASLPVSKIKTAYQTTDDGYTMEIQMPWSVVGFVPQGTADMGFDLMAFDKGENNVLVWSGSSSDWKDTSDFGTLVFTGDGTEPNGQTLSLDRYVFAKDSAIGMYYAKAVEGDELAIVKQGKKLSDGTSLISKDLPEGSGRLTIDADENKLAVGDYDAIFGNTKSGAEYTRESFSIGEVKITTDQTSYVKSDKADITVHYDNAANGSWVGIYHKGDTPGGGTPSIVWKYTDSTSGDMSFTTQDFLDSTHPDFKGKNIDYLRTGSYEAILFQDGGYTIDQRCPFTVTGAELSLPQTTYPLDFKIQVDYTGTDAVNNKDWVGVYKKGTTPSGNADDASLVYKYATGDSGTLTFTQQDFKDYTSGPLKGQSLPEGDYELILMENDGYSILDRTGFTVKDSAVYTPVSVTYNRSGARTGYADGTVTITDTAHPTTTQYALYWGDANGKLAGYNSIDTVMRTDDTTTYTMTTNTFIPTEATRLLAYASNGSSESDAPVSFDLPASAKFTAEAPLYTFNVISDTHVASWDSSTVNTDMAFKDIKKNDPKSSGIFLVGDMVDSGLDDYYAKFQEVLNANKDGLPPINYTIGNHEFMATTNNPEGHSVDGKMQKWLDNTKEPNVYYDKYINGQHFIVMGSEETGVYQDDDCYISETQFNWLRQKLAETKNKKEPIFLFLHQSMSNTVAGSIGIKGTPGAQGWYGMKPDQEAELRDILKDYPQVTLFNGHSHWILESNHEMYDGKSSFASIFNTAAVGYLWDDAQEYVAGGEGLYLEVYKDKILVKGRNFTTGTWIPKAFFSVDLNEKYQNISDGTNPGNDPGNNPGNNSGNNSGSNSGGTHNSGSQSGSTAVGSQSTSTFTKTVDSTGKTVVTISAQPDSAPTLTGGNSSVQVTVPADAVAGLSGNAALKVAAPESTLLGQLNSAGVQNVALTVQVPSGGSGIPVSVSLPTSALQAAKDQMKGLTLQVTDSQTGKVVYSWTFSGEALSGSASAVIPVDTAVTVTPVSSESSASAVVAAHAGGHQTAGIVVHFAENGLLPGPASVRIYVGDKANCKPNSKVFLYYLNQTAGVLEQMPKAEYTVDSDGYVNLFISHCSSYVLLPKAAADAYPVKSDTTYPVKARNGKTYTFAMTVTGNAVPVFTTGNGKVFSGSVRKQGSRYYYTVTAVGRPGESTAVYCTLPKQKAVPMCYLIVGK